MIYNVESSKSFIEAAADLESVVLRLGFAVLHIHDLGETLRRKGIDFDEECRIFEVHSARQTGKMLAADRRLSLMLPWRISLYTDHGATRIGLFGPRLMLDSLSSDAGLQTLAAEIEAKLIQMVDEAR